MIRRFGAAPEAGRRYHRRPGAYAILPLDGGRMLVGVLPRAYAIPFAKTERYGFLVLIGVIFILPLIADAFGVFFNPLAWILLPIVDWLSGLLLTTLGFG